MISELQPVILAAGEGSMMFPLTENLPKCLLPIGNVPLIWYPVSYLQNYGFQDFIVIVRHGVAEKVNGVLQAFFGKSIKLDLVTVNDEDDLATAESLKLLKDKVKTDLLVVSCDIITDAPLHRLVDIHRTYDSSVSIMLADRVDVNPQVEKVSKGKKLTDAYGGMRDFVSVDEKEGRLLYFVNERDIKQDNIVIRKSLLKRYPHMKIKSNLSDSHIYIMKKWLFDYLIDNEKFERLKADFIPHVVRKQFSKSSSITSTTTLETTATYDRENDGENFDRKNATDIFSYACVDELTKSMREWSGYQGSCLHEPIKCYAYVSNDFCLRVNTLPSYTYMNRQIMKMKFAQQVTPNKIHATVSQQGKSQIGTDCLVGESTSLGNAVTVKNSMIGRHCNIDSNVRITNSIVMDHVTVADGCTLQGTVLCERSRVLNNCNLINCQVAANQIVKENSDLKDEGIIENEMEFDDDDEDEDGDIYGIKK